MNFINLFVLSRTMKIWDFKGIFTRTVGMLVHPDTEWQAVKQDKAKGPELFRAYFIPLAVVGAIATLGLQLLHTPPLYATATGLIALTASVSGAYISYRVSREYLAGKIMEENRVSICLATYSSGVFALFYYLTQGLPDGFFCQLMALLSLFSLRTLYSGIKQIAGLNVQYRKSILVIVGLTIIVSPLIVQRLLMTIFRIPTITLNI